MPYALDHRRGELSEVVQLFPGCAIAWTVARIAAGLDIWQGLQPSDHGIGCPLPMVCPGRGPGCLCPIANAWTLYS